MPKPETFTAKLFCPNCRTTGTAECQENRNPHEPDKLDRVILSVSAGFQAGGYVNGNQQIICSRCRSMVPV